MNLKDSVSFKNLPLEIHTAIARYLPVIDCQVLSQTCTTIRSIYNSASLKCILIVNENGNISPNKSPYWARPIPVRVFVNPHKYSWFSNQTVQIVLNGQLCVNRERIISQHEVLNSNSISALQSNRNQQRFSNLLITVHFNGADSNTFGVTDFSWIPATYPALHCFQYEYCSFFYESVSYSPTLWHFTTAEELGAFGTQSNYPIEPASESSLQPIDRANGRYSLRWLSNNASSAQNFESDVFNSIFNFNHTKDKPTKIIPFIDLTCYPENSFMMFNSCKCSEFIKSLTLSWESGSRLIDFVFPYFPNLERFIFRPPEFFPYHLYINILFELGKLVRLNYVATLHHITRLTNTTIAGMVYLPLSLNFCEIVLSCRKMKYDESEIPPRAVIPQVTHLTVNDLKRLNYLYFVASFPNLETLSLTRVSATHGFSIDSQFRATLKQLDVYSETKVATLNFAYHLQGFENLKILTFIPTAINYEFYGRAVRSPADELQVQSFYDQTKQACIGPDDSTSDIAEKLARLCQSNSEGSTLYSSKRHFNIMVNMIADPLVNLELPGIHGVMYAYSFWELLFRQVRLRLPNLEYLSVSEYYAVKKSLNFKWMLQSHKNLKQIMFASEKLDCHASVTSLFGPTLSSYVSTFEDRRHLLDLQFLRHELHHFSKHGSQTIPIPSTVSQAPTTVSLFSESSNLPVYDPLKCFYKQQHSQSDFFDNSVDDQESGRCDPWQLCFRHYNTEGRYQRLGNEYCATYKGEDAMTDRYIHNDEFSGWVV